MVNSFTVELLNACMNQSTEISQNALEGLSTIALLYEKLERLDVVSYYIIHICIHD